MENALKFTKNDVHKLICFLKNKHLILRDLGPNLPLSQQTTRLRNYFAIPNLSIKKISFGIKGLNYFPKRFLSWGFKTLFASASSCQCIPPQFSSPVGQCRVNLDRPGSSGRTRFWPSCSARRAIFLAIL